MSKVILNYGRNHSKTYAAALIMAEKAIELSEYGKFKIDIEVKSTQMEEVFLKLNEIKEFLKNG